MIVRLEATMDIAGHHKAGDTFEAESDIAQSLIDRGLAVSVDGTLTSSILRPVPPEAEVHAMTVALNEASERYDQLDADHSVLRADYDELLSAKTHAVAEYDKLNARYTSLQQEHTALQAERDKLRAENTTARQQLEQVQGELDAAKAAVPTVPTDAAANKQGKQKDK